MGIGWHAGSLALPPDRGSRERCLGAALGRFGAPGYFQSSATMTVSCTYMRQRRTPGSDTTAEGLGGSRFCASRRLVAVVYNETDSLDFISRDAIMEVRALATLFVDFRSDGSRPDPLRKQSFGSGCKVCARKFSHAAEASDRNHARGGCRIRLQFRRAAGHLL